MCRGKAMSCFAGLLLCFLQLTFVPPQKTCASDTQRTCAASSCGKIANISHPFRLKGDPENCGDPRYELKCENGMTMLTLYSGTYYVKAINYNNFTIRLVDPAIQEADCSSIPRYLLSSSNFTENGPYQATGDRLVNGDYTYTALFQHVIYMNCSNAVRDDPQYVDTAPCINRHSTGHFYAIAGDLLVGNIKAGCQMKLVAATSFLGLTTYGDILYHQTLSYAEIHSMLVYGFDVSWLDRACDDHCKSQVCCFNVANQILHCRPLSFFSTPLGFEARCGNMPKLVKLGKVAEDYVFGVLEGLLQIAQRGDGDSHVSGVIQIGIVTGRYVLPYVTVRFILGLIVCFALLIYTCRRRHASMYENIEDFLRGNTLMPIRYSYKEIKKMTRGFKDKLGEGGYGSVYKGKLRSGPFVAIKMLTKAKANGQDFINEVATIGRIHHANVVRLVGFCVEGSKRALVYEFMLNGSLDRYIFSKEGSIPLTYEKMYDVSLEVARGIAYLHEGCEMQILHFDIKPHNILLDENFIPKVSDFGLAKLYPTDNSVVPLTVARGTIGYMAPELFYQNIGGVSYKADVYSYGMLLMEMTSRRRNLNPHAEHSSQLYFPFWIYDQLIKESDIELEDVTKEEKNNLAKKMFIVALWCIQLKPIDRPSMNKVVEMLEGEVENIEMPPKPSLYPHEMIQGEYEINSNQIEPDDSTSSTTFLDESTTDPLLKYST